MASQWEDGWGSSGSRDNPNDDAMVKDPPKNTISRLRFSPTSDAFAVTTWNGDLAVYRHNEKGDTKMKGVKKHDRPALDLTWDHTGDYLFSCGCDNSARVWNLKKDQWSALGIRHEASISHIEYSKEKTAIVTASWDKTVSFWDLRDSKVVKKMGFRYGKKAACMCLKSTMLVFGLSLNSYDIKNKKGPTIQVYDIRNLDKPRSEDSPHLKHQLRCMRALPKHIGYATASVEGRCSINFFEADLAKRSFSFKCHRQQSSSYDSSKKDVYGVNDVAFHGHFNTFATCGSDGEINIWDPFQRSRVKHFKRLPIPITSMDFNKDGRVLAYATGYDWSKGAEFYNPEKMKPKIYLHKVKQDEVDSQSSAHS